MEQIQCASCNLVNLPGATVCSGCGAELLAPARPAIVEAAPAPVVVERQAPVIIERGMSDSAKLLTALATIVGVVLVGFVFYQWGRTESSEEQAARVAAERNANARSTSDRQPPTRTEPAQPPVVIVPGASTAPAPTAPAIDSPQTTAPSVDREVVRYTATVDPLLKRWKTELKKAEAARGAELTASIVALQDIQREASRVTPAPMATGVHTHLLELMTATMEALDTASQTQTTVSTLPDYVEVRELFDRFETEYSALRPSRG